MHLPKRTTKPVALQEKEKQTNGLPSIHRRQKVMYPPATKFSQRSPSPQFSKLSPPMDYPSAGVVHHHHHNHTMSMRHSKSKMAQGGVYPGMVTSATMSGVNHAGFHHPNDIMYQDDMESVEFCLPPEHLMRNGSGGGMIMPSDSFTDGRRRGHRSRRSNHKMDVEQQVYLIVVYFCRRQ